METVTNFIFLGSKISADGDCSHEIKDTCSLEEKLWPTSVQFNSVTQSCLTLYNPIGYSMPGCNVQHKLPELTQTPVPRVSDTVHPSHCLLFPSPPDFNFSQHQGLLQWVSSSHQLAKALGFFIVQLSHPYMTTGKTIALTRQTIVGKVGRKWRRTKEPLDKSETGEWKSWLNTQHSEN